MASPGAGRKEQLTNGYAHQLHEEEECLIQLCEDLQCSEELKEACQEHLKAVFLSDSREERHKLSRTQLQCCLLYVAQVHLRMPFGPVDRQLDVSYLDPPSFTVTELLHKTDMTMTSLFQSMKVLKEMISIGDMVSQHLMALEKKYCIVSALFYKLERVCETVFRAESKPEIEANTENLMPPMPESEGAPIRKRRCWTLFLHAKSSNYLAESQELVQAFHLLLGCLEYVLRSTPSFLLNPPFDTIRIGCPQSSESRSVTMLGKLAEQFKTSLDEVHTMQHNFLEPFLRELPHIEGELDFERLEEQYETACRREGDINELLFLDHDPHLLPMAITRHVTQPSSGAAPLTPVRASLNTIQQLKSILSSSRDEPSARLLDYIKKCSVNPLPAIKARLERLREAFVEQFLKTTSSKPSQKPIALQRFRMAVSLYYRVMESMLNAEAERLSITDFSGLLNKEDFHLSLLGCSTEVVLVTHSLTFSLASGAAAVDNSSVAFPWVLSVYGLQAFDFFKMIESYIKNEPKLTPDIIRHLHSVEDRILEKIAWQEGSILFTVMGSAGGAPASTASSSSLDLPSTSSAPADLYASPVRTRPATRSATQTSAQVNGNSPHSTAPPASQDPTSPNKQQRRQTSLDLFMKKACRLGYVRLTKMCGILQIQEGLLNKIWTCFEHCIMRMPELMKNRHMDQLMMCCIFGVSKAMEKDIKFKGIVQHYRDLFNPEQAVYKGVHIKGDEHDSIMALYNKVFLVVMKDFVLQFSSNKQEIPLSPVPRLVSSPKVSSSVRVPGMKNFYVSPLKHSPFKTPSSPGQMTPRTHQLYCFGESSEKLRSINQSLSGMGGLAGPGRGLKRLVFDRAPPETVEVLPKKIIRKLSTEPGEPSGMNGNINGTGNTNGNGNTNGTGNTNSNGSERSEDKSSS